MAGGQPISMAKARAVRALTDKSVSYTHLDVYKRQDMVLAWRALKAGEVARAKAGVEACRQACGTGIVLKLILETGELANPALIRHACEIGLDAGVDFLKTSTGKVPVNATLPAATLMLDAIAERGGQCGLKVAGGIRTLAEAQEYLALVDAKPVSYTHLDVYKRQEIYCLPGV